MLRRAEDDNDYLVARDLDDLEARGNSRVHWHQAGKVAKAATKIGAELLLNRAEDGDDLEARDPSRK